MSSVQTRARSMRPAPQHAQLVLLGAIWGASTMLIKIVVEHVPPLWLVAGRIWAGLAVVLLLLGVRKRRLPRSLRVWWHLVVLGTLGTAVPWLLAAWAQQSLPATLGAVLAAPTPATTLALAAAAGVERITRRRVLGLLVSLAGTLAIVGSGLEGGGPRTAILATAATTLLFSFGTVYTKRFLDGVPGTTVAAGQLLASALFVLPITLFVGQAPRWGAVPLAAWVLWLVLGAVSTGLAHVLFYGLLDRVGPSTAQAVSYLAPPVGAAVGWLVLNEPVGTELVVGTGVILLGLVVSNRTGSAVPWSPRRIARQGSAAVAVLAPTAHGSIRLVPWLVTGCERRLPRVCATLRDRSRSLVPSLPRRGRCHDLP